MSKPEVLRDQDLIALARKAAGLISLAPDAAERRQDAKLSAAGLCEPVTCRDGAPHPALTKATAAGCAMARAQAPKLAIMRITGVWRSRQARPMSARQAAGSGGEMVNG